MRRMGLGAPYPHALFTGAQLCLIHGWPGSDHRPMSGLQGFQERPGRQERAGLGRTQKGEDPQVREGGRIGHPWPGHGSWRAV